MFGRGVVVKERAEGCGAGAPERARWARIACTPRGSYTVAMTRSRPPQRARRGEIRHGGLTVLIVEQDAASTFRVADRLYVLEHGRVAKEGDAVSLQQDESIRQLYLGVD